jgi:hypothetical protein
MDPLLDGIELERGRLRAIRTELIDDRLQVRLEVVVLAHSTPYYERARRFLIEDV